MKYSGTIIGLKTSFGNIYNVVLDDTKCYLWKANVDAEISGKMLKIVFNWNGDSFDLTLTVLKENYYTGKISCAGEGCGNIFLWQYSKGDEIILKGDFNEDGAGNYDCFIELRPMKGEY